MKKIFAALFFLLLFSAALAKEETEFVCEIKKDKIECKLPGVNLKKIMNVFATEYLPNAKGTVYLQLLDSGEPVNNATCFLDLWRYDKSEWLTDAPMNFLEEGVYYYDLFTPSEEGVNLLTVYCRYFYDTRNYFASNYTVTSGSVSGDLSATYKKDGTVQSASELPTTFDVTYEFKVNVTNETTMGVFWHGRYSATSEKVSVYVYNFSSKSWISLPNKISYSSYYIDVNNVVEGNLSQLVENNTVLVRLNDTSAKSGGVMETDYLSVGIYFLSGAYVSEIRGGGEIHVTNFYKAFELPEERLISNKDYCVDNQTLRKELLVEKCVDDVCFNVTRNEEIVCDYGCENNECRRPPYVVYGILLGIVVFLVFLYFVFR